MFQAPIYIINKLFNTLFSPILTYCSKFWESLINGFIVAGKKTPLGKHIIIHFGKICLGLDKRSPNVASNGRLSLRLQILLQ